MGGELLEIGISVAALGSGVPLFVSSKSKIKILTKKLKKHAANPVRTAQLKKQLRKWKSLRAFAIALISAGAAGGGCVASALPLVWLSHEGSLSKTPAFMGPSCWSLLFYNLAAHYCSR